MEKSRLYRCLILLPVLVFGCKEKEVLKPPPPKIQVVDVIQKDVPLYREFIGQTYGMLDIPIRARVEGFLQGRHFKEGGEVKKGQLLYSIDQQEFLAEVVHANSELAQAQSIYINARNDLARYKPLAEINAVSQSDLDAAQAMNDAAESAVKAAEANLELAEINLSYTKIKSPITGLIGKTNARRGEFVGRQPNPVILNTVSRIDTIRVEFHLTEGDYLSIAREVSEERRKDSLKHTTRRDTSDKLIFELILSDESIYGYKGKLDFVDRSIDPTTGSMLVQASFPNPYYILRPGLFAKVKIEMDLEEGALLVPQRCVMDLQGEKSVFVVSDSNIVSSRSVVMGTTIGDFWLVLDGLAPGERVVIDGLQKVRTGMEIIPVQQDFKSKFE